MPRSCSTGCREAASTSVGGGTEAAGGGWPAGHPPVSLNDQRGYAIPAAVQADAYCEVQMSVLLQNPSAITVEAIVLLITATGVSSTEGMSLDPLLTVLPFVIDEGTAVPLARS